MLHFHLYVFVLLTQLYRSADAQETPQSRDDYTEDKEYSKVNVGLTSIPTDIPGDARLVNIALNNIPQIPANIFSHLSQCEDLRLWENNITQIEPGAFNGLISLQTIYLSSNKLAAIPADIPASIVRLYLNVNSITNIPVDIFVHLGECITLNLASNDLTAISPGAFNGLNNIKRIDLYGNKLTELNSRMFQGAESVQTLQPYYNDITIIAVDTFINLRNLTQIFLNENNLGTILPQTFNGLDNLQLLSLAGNSLTMFPVDIFGDIPRPLELRMHRNPLICDAALCWLKQEELQGAITWYTYGDTTLKPECANGVDWETWVCTLPAATTVRTYDDSPNGLNTSDADSDTNDSLQWILITVGAVIVTAIVTAVFLVIYFKRRFCFKRKSGIETQVQANTSNNNVNTGFTNRAVSMGMEQTDGYQGLQREVEGYEKLRQGSNMYEEIPESVDGYLDPQISGHEIPDVTAETDINGYLHPQTPSEEYDYVDNM